MEQHAELYLKNILVSKRKSRITAGPYNETLKIYLGKDPWYLTVNENENYQPENPQYSSSKYETSLEILREIVVDWAKACNIFPLPENVEIRELQTHIESTLVDIRCSAIVSSVWYAQDVEDGDIKANLVYQLFHHMTIDNSRLVRMAAALAIQAWTCNRVNTVKKILEKCLKSLVWADSWAAARCLAHFWRPINRDLVINVILKYLNKTAIEVEKKKGFELLQLMSKSSNEIESAVLQKLSKESFNERLTACHVLANLPVANPNERIRKLRSMMIKSGDSRLLDAAATLLNELGCEDLVKKAIVKLLPKQLVSSTTSALYYITNYVEKSDNPKWIPIILCCLRHESPSMRSLACLVVERQCFFNNTKVIAGLAELAYGDSDKSVQDIASTVLIDLGIKF